MKVLIADDDRATSAVLTAMLKSLGHSVIAVENGIEAVDAVRRHAPDVAILDFLMPRLSGIEALKAIRSHYLGTTGQEVGRLPTIKTRRGSGKAQREHG